MTKLKFLFFIFFLVIMQIHTLYGQGCSDAGFCTINSFQPASGDSVKAVSNQIKIGVFLGNADHAIRVYGNYLEYHKAVNKKVGLDFKLTTLAQTGNNIGVFGLSDFYLNANYKAFKGLKFTLGAKIPLMDASKSQNNLPLPMDYQSSLGTFDLIFGVGYKIKKLQIIAAIQQPLTQNNNQFFASQYPLNSELRKVQSTNNFKRSGDVLIRVSYPIAVSSKFKLTPSILPIYHLANDTYTNELHQEQEIMGSQGLTLNGNIYLEYEINKNNLIQINMGAPFIVRDSRPDGLTRSYMVNFEYRFKF